MDKIKLAINGFGRIGRAAFKIALETPNIQVVAINDLAAPMVLAHLLKYDTAYGVYPRDLKVLLDKKEVSLHDYDFDNDIFEEFGKENYLVVDDAVSCRIFSEKDPAKLPWKSLGVDVVLECTGFFTKDDAAKAHLDAGAKKVIISAPAKGESTQTFVFGANDITYSGQNIISNASCTTNCVSPVVAVLHSKFKILKAGMTTVHAITAGQNVVDGPPSPRKPDLRRARAAGWNIIPTSTGAAEATAQTVPELAGLFDGLAIRVPVITGSLSDITLLVEKKTSVKEVNKALTQAAAKKNYQKVLKVSNEPIVSSDVIGSPFSAIVDLQMTKVIDGDMVKVLAWYDNEWGYSNRLVEMAVFSLQSNHSNSAQK